MAAGSGCSATPPRPCAPLPSPPSGAASTRRGALTATAAATAATAAAAAAATAGPPRYGRRKPSAASSRRRRPSKTPLCTALRRCGWRRSWIPHPSCAARRSATPFTSVRRVVVRSHQGGALRVGAVMMVVRRRRHAVARISSSYHHHYHHHQPQRRSAVAQHAVAQHAVARTQPPATPTCGHRVLCMTSCTHGRYPTS
eukprot:COSAG01_NODE_5866_length_3982_cov_17.229204_4_plen_199_part_00